MWLISPNHIPIARSRSFAENISHGGGGQFYSMAPLALLVRSCSCCEYAAVQPTGQPSCCPLMRDTLGKHRYTNKRDSHLSSGYRCLPSVSHFSGQHDGWPVGWTASNLQQETVYHKQRYGASGFSLPLCALVFTVGRILISDDITLLPWNCSVGAYGMYV